MKKVCITLFTIAFIGCSTDEPEKSNGNDGEWISPRQCYEFVWQNPKCDLEPHCSRHPREYDEYLISMLEEHGCVMRKSACIDDDLIAERDMKCARELED